jgi:hypothetical protein
MAVPRTAGNMRCLRSRTPVSLSAPPARRRERLRLRACSGETLRAVFEPFLYTDIQVRDGDLIYAISFISVPDTGMASLAVLVMRALIARERSVCG